MAEYDLSLVDTDDLIEEIAARGVASVLGFVRADGNMRKGHHQLSLIIGGDKRSALWAVANLYEKALVHAEDDGLDKDEIEMITSHIVYNEDEDPERLP